MQIIVKNTNALPLRTWRWLGVNSTTFTETIPEILPLQNPPAPELPVGVKSMPMPEAFANMQTSAGSAAQEFVEQWRNAGAHLHIGGAVPENRPLVYHYTLGKNCPAVVDENTIWAAPNSDITLLMLYTSGDNFPAFHAGLTRIIAEENAHVRLVQVQMLNNTSAHWSSVGAVLKTGAQLEVVQLELGAKRALAGCHTLLEGNQSRADVNTVYFGDGTRSLDFNYIAKHTGQNTQSNMQANGALFDECQKIYRGTIDFASGSAHSVGHETENTLLFSPNTRNRSAPLILCGEENVEGQHAATIGKIDASKLFYLNSRGISSMQAKRMMVEARFAPAIAAVPDEALRAQITTFIAERMHAL